ncbi:hypothetical protein ALC53_02562, partial [Atta colombica]
KYDKSCINYYFDRVIERECDILADEREENSSEVRIVPVNAYKIFGKCKLEMRLHSAPEASDGKSRSELESIKQPVNKIAHSECTMCDTISSFSRQDGQANNKYKAITLALCSSCLGPRCTRERLNRRQSYRRGREPTEETQRCRNNRGIEREEKKTILRGAVRSLQEDAPSPPSKTNSYFKAEPSMVYSSTKRDASSEIKVKYAGSLLKAVLEEERGYKARDKRSRSFVIRRRPLSHIAIID